MPTPYVKKINKVESVTETMSDRAPIRLPKNLHNEIEKILEDERNFYTDFSEFLEDAVRKHVEIIVKPNIQLIVLNRLEKVVAHRQFEKIFEK